MPMLSEEQIHANNLEVNKRKMKTPRIELSSRIVERKRYFSSFESSEAYLSKTPASNVIAQVEAKQKKVSAVYKRWR